VPQKTWHDLYAYWRDHHVDGHPPSRADIDPPLEIPALLPNLMLVDVTPAGLRMRLVGSELTRRTRLDLTGKIIAAGELPGRDIAGFVELLAKVATSGTPVLYRVEHSAHGAYSAVGILLPLMGRTGAVEMVLGGFFFGRSRTPDMEPDWAPGRYRELSIADTIPHAADD
jgi:hypothetical protein